MRLTFTPLSGATATTTAASVVLPMVVKAVQPDAQPDRERPPSAF